MGVGLAAGLGLVAVAITLVYGNELGLVNGLMAVGLGGFLVCGIVIVLRADGHPVGWLFMLSGALGLSIEASAAFALAWGPRGIGVVAGWISSWLWLPALLPLLTVGLLVFPTGRSLSTRWRRAAVASVILIALLTVVSWFAPGHFPVRGTPFAANPLAIEGLAGVEAVVSVAGFPAVVLLILVSSVGLIVRFRRAAGVERLQLKWFALAAVAFAAGAVVNIIGELAGLPDEALGVLMGLLFLGLPVAATVAILRHDLYQIDRIVSRTVAYAVLTMLVAGVYGGGVLLLGALLAPLGEGSQLAVAGSTLAAVAVFGRARRRVQAAVDRRFNRAHFDAAEAVAAFRSGLRTRVDLEDVSRTLLAATAETMAPERTALWLRHPTGPGSQEDVRKERRS